MLLADARRQVMMSSIPSGGTKNAGIAHLVERHLAKVEVASSSLVARSIIVQIAFRFFAECDFFS